MRFQVLAKPTIDHQDKRVPAWLEREPGVTVRSRSDDRLIAYIETDPLTASKLRLKLGDAWYVLQIGDDGQVIPQPVKKEEK